MTRFWRACGFLLLLAGTLPLFAKDDWLPITPADLSYTDPGGAPAVMLYLQEDNDGNNFVQTAYVRIKVLADEGKKYADVRIYYVKDYYHLDNIEARVVQPDGAIVKFDGKVYDKTETKYRSIRFFSKTFTLPDVRVGSIIEYRYKIKFDRPYLIDSDFPLQRNLPVKKAHFTFRPYMGGGVTRLTRIIWTGIHLPWGLRPEKQGDAYVLDLENLPALPDERFAPPEDWTRGIVRFEYSQDEDLALPPVAFWRKKSSRMAEYLDNFLAKHSAVDPEAARLVAPGDTPEAKLRKLYARAQRIRNLGFERRRTEKEIKKEGLKDNQNVDDVLKRGYGSSYDVNLFFVALARAAGFDATIAWAATRDRMEFIFEIPDFDQLRDHVVYVKYGDKQSIFLDPATPYCPFGLLDWRDTGVAALPVDKAGADFVKTTVPRSADATIVRRARLRFDAGSLAGTLNVDFTGLEALRWRLDMRDDDEVARRKELESEVKKWLPAAATVDLVSAAGWDKVEEPLTAEFKITVPDAAPQTGKRILLPTGVFQGNDSHPFQNADRKLPIYFSYPFQEIDDVAIEFPAGFEVEATPQPRDQKTESFSYQRTASFKDGKLRLERKFSIEEFIFPKPTYNRVRGFWNFARAGDSETLILRKAAE
jgi:hypothetical protein